MNLEEQLRKLSIPELHQAMDYIRYLIKNHKEGPKWPGGVTLWHKIWRKKVRAVYPDSDEECEFNVIAYWNNVHQEWSYIDKYSGDEMLESDLEPYNPDVHKG